ncbi:MAG: glycosyltransferase family 2 protein [Acidimicrobiia bacterium]
MFHDVTVCIPTYNGEEFLTEIFKQLFSQVTNYSYNVLVIDSGSTDKTLEIIRNFPEVNLHEIPNDQFGHGKTRNLAVELADSEFMVFLTQDAVPANENWLESLLEPFRLFENVTCVFGKQIPRPDCVAPLKREVALVFNSFGDDASISIQRKSEINDKYNIVNNFLSDVNSAMRREYLLKVPFRDVEYAEDQALGKDHLENGWLKAYVPLGAVYHSHNYSIKSFYKRKIDERIGVYRATGEIYAISRVSRLKGFISHTLKDWNFIRKDDDYNFIEKVKNFVKSPIYNWLLFKCYWIAKDPSKHEKYMKHSLDASKRNAD